MFTDPIVTPIGGASATLARISLKEGSCTYRTADGDNTLAISHITSKGRTRSLIRFDVMETVLSRATGTDTTQRFTAYVVIDEPSRANYDYSANLASGLFGDLSTFLTSNTNEAIDKVLASET